MVFTCLKTRQVQLTDNMRLLTTQARCTTVLRVAHHPMGQQGEICRRCSVKRGEQRVNQWVHQRVHPIPNKLSKKLEHTVYGFLAGKSCFW